MGQALRARRPAARRAAAAARQVGLPPGGADRRDGGGGDGDRGLPRLRRHPLDPGRDRGARRRGRAAPGRTGSAALLRVRGVGLRGAAAAAIDVGNAGTLLRLLPGWLAGQEEGAWTLDGDESIRRRPVDRIVAPLRLMGADLGCREERLPPLRVEAAPLRGISYELPVASAQVKSCLLFAGLLADGRDARDRAAAEPRPQRADAARRRAPGSSARARRSRSPGGAARRPVGSSSPPTSPRRPSSSWPACSSRAARSPCRGSASTRPGPACWRSSSGWALRSTPRPREKRAASRSARSSRAPPGCGEPRWAAPMCRWRSTSCRWSRSRPASPRARRRSATRPSCGARRATGSRRSPRR